MAANDAHVKANYALKDAQIFALLETFTIRTDAVLVNANQDDVRPYVKCFVYMVTKLMKMVASYADANLVRAG